MNAPDPRSASGTPVEAAPPSDAAGPWHVPLPRRARRVKTADVRGVGVNARIARGVTAAVGTMYAFYALALFMAVWILWQSRLDKAPFDPYPFAFLLFLGNIVQLLLMPLIMVGQNVQSDHADARAEADFEVDRKNEQEVEKILEGLRMVDRRTEEILQRLEALEAAGRSRSAGGSATAEASGS